MRWGVERRLEFIEFRLYWEGKVNRGDLVHFFNISVPQASGDLSRYQSLAPDNLAYDKNVKAYLPTKAFTPRFLKPSADAYLARLRSLAGGVFSEVDTWLDPPPPYGSVPLLRRKVPPESLRRVLEAIHSAADLEIHYQSLSNPEPKRRWIGPHAIAFDGFRWHARAWCYEHREFRDFVLTRMTRFGGAKPCQIDNAKDSAWNHEITLRLAPRGDLTLAERRTVEQDYQLIDGCIQIKMRVALSSYFERLLGLDLNQESIPTFRIPLCLVNRHELETARAAARADVEAYARELPTANRLA